MTNPILTDFIDRLDTRFSRDYQDMPTSQWVTENTFFKGKPFSFEDYPFQKQIMDDLHPNFSCIKISQVGISEVQIRKMIALLMRNRGTKGIYTLPNLKMQSRISQTRIAPIVRETPLLQNDKNEEAVRSMGIVQMDDSYLFITASNEGDATSIDADFLFNDEVDITDQNMLALFASRLQNSQFKIHQKFSTPTFPGMGMDREYAVSDQKEYWLRCHACGHEQIPDFTRAFCDIPGLPDDVEHLTDLEQEHVNKMDLMEARVVCERCRRPVDLKDADHRFWLANYPERRHASGYKIRPFSSDRVPIYYIIDRLMRAKALGNVRSFHNTVLGNAFAASNNRMTQEQIERCFTAHSRVSPPPSKGVWIGADMGLTCHYVVGVGNSVDDVEVIEFGVCPPEELQDRLTRTYPRIIGGVVDRLPYTPTALALSRATNGRIVPVQYGGQVTVTWKQDENYATANRTLCLDEVLRQVNRGIRFSGYQHHKGTIITHLMDMIRDDNKPEGWADWIKVSGQDHFFHALGYMLLSFKLTDIIRAAFDGEMRIMAGAQSQDLDKFYGIRPTLGIPKLGTKGKVLTSTVFNRR